MSEPGYKNKTAYRIATLVPYGLLILLPGFFVAHATILENNAKPTLQAAWTQLYFAPHPRWHIWGAISATSFVCLLTDWVRSRFGPEERSAETTISHQDKSITALVACTKAYERNLELARHEHSVTESKLEAQSKHYAAAKTLYDQKISLYEITLGMVLASLNRSIELRTKVIFEFLRLADIQSSEKLLKKQLQGICMAQNSIIKNMIILEDCALLDAQSYCSFYRYLDEEFKRITDPTEEEVKAALRRAHARVSQETNRAIQGLTNARSQAIANAQSTS